MSELTYPQRRAFEALLRRTVDAVGERVGAVARGVVRVVRKAMEDGVGEKVAKVLEAHAADAPPAGPHAAHIRAEEENGGVAVHHEHSPDADQDHLGRVRADLMAIPGVKRCSQSTRPPSGPGWRQCYAMPARTEDDQDAGAGPQGGGGGEAVMPTKSLGPPPEPWWPWAMADPPRRNATAQEILGAAYRR
jgi:hypothetical protein